MRLRLTAVSCFQQLDDSILSNVFSLQAEPDQSIFLRAGGEIVHTVHDAVT